MSEGYKPIDIRSPGELMNLSPEEIVEYFEKKSGTASAKTSA